VSRTDEIMLDLHKSHDSCHHDSNNEKSIQRVMAAIVRIRIWNTKIRMIVKRILCWQKQLNWVSVFT
jgi:thiamine kinase-like enzyme